MKDVVMESSRKKREFLAYVLLLFGTVLMVKSYYAGAKSFAPVKEQEQKVTEDPQSQKPRKRPKTAVVEEIVFWYFGEENEEYFNRCAESFFEETGIAVLLEQKQPFAYFSSVYDASKTGEGMPDAYLLPAEQLMQAYYTQILQENKRELPEDCAETAKGVCSFAGDGKQYGYPLYFNTSVFAYRTDYFETAPASIQEIIDYSIEHEPAEGVEKLLEWDLSDARSNFAFLGDGIAFSEAEGCIAAEYRDEVFEEGKAFFGNLTAVIALDEDELSGEKVAQDFADGKTVAVLLSAEDLGEIEGGFGVEVLPKLNEDLNMCAISETTVACVNGLTEKSWAAQEFAAYVSSADAQKGLRKSTGHFPVAESALSGELETTAWRQYEKGRAKPNGLNATDFWVKFQSQALKVWNDAE